MTFVRSETHGKRMRLALGSHQVLFLSILLNGTGEEGHRRRDELYCVPVVSCRGRLATQPVCLETYAESTRTVAHSEQPSEGRPEPASSQPKHPFVLE
jgi:hypothetical protein